MDMYNYDNLIPFIKHEERTDGTYRITEYFYPSQKGTAPVKVEVEKIGAAPAHVEVGRKI